MPNYFDTPEPVMFRSPRYPETVNCPECAREGLPAECDVDSDTGEADCPEHGTWNITAEHEAAKADYLRDDFAD